MEKDNEIYVVRNVLQHIFGPNNDFLYVYKENNGIFIKDNGKYYINEELLFSLLLQNEHSKRFISERNITDWTDLVIYIQETEEAYYSV